MGPGSNLLSRALLDYAEWAFRIFSTRDEDAHQWHQPSDSQKQDKDIFFGIEYARAYERSQGCKVLLASYTVESGRILMPFALRDLRRLPFMARAGIDGPVYDMTSLYPFGGPIAFLNRNEASEQLHHNFHKFLSS